MFALLVTNVGDGFPSLRDGRRSRARHAQAGDVGAQRGCPTWVPNVLVRNVGDGRPSLGDGRPSRARHAQAGDVMGADHVPTMSNSEVHGIR